MFTKAALCAVLYSLSASLLVASAPAEISVLPSRTVEPVVPVWPEYAFPGEHDSDELSVAASLAKKETNGDRMKRGMGPNAPAKLYNAKRHGALKPRLSGAPLSTGSYTFQGCAATTDERGFYAQYTQPANIDDVLSHCAYLNANQGTDDSGGPSNTFSVAIYGYTSGGQPLYQCALAVYSYTTGPCTETNPALYTKP